MYSGMRKECECIIKVVKKKTGSLFRNLGCEIFKPVDDLMMEVHAVYNFTTMNLMNKELFGNTCPVGTDEEFMEFAQTVKDFSLNLVKPCKIPGRFESVDADFDSGLVEAVTPILPKGAYNAYVRVYRAEMNQTLAFQTLYGSTPVFDPSSIPVVNSIMSFFG
ncbi:uncharacterized protein LOC134827414 [Culicoides brevitarsis]|uniref:uncharacterized protein LOC134827414 n=1 Tax=Culicoides brevitarsis TaxID=469753 RepID=UPI00307CC7AA